jgi:hypothetical protein
MLRELSDGRGYANMRIARAGALLCAAALAGCAGTRLSADAPPDLSLAGAWKLDRAASDDPQKVLERMRAEAFRRMARRAVASTPGPGARGAGTRTAQRPDDAPFPADSAPADPAPVSAGSVARPDPLTRSPMAQLLRASIARGDFLTVRQAPGEFVLDYGNSQRRFTPGAQSVVSAQDGVADQRSGWKGREYVVELRGQSGPDVTERYALSADGRRLVEKLHIGAEELSAVDLTRVYVPAGETTPTRQTPTSD